MNNKITYIKMPDNNEWGVLQIDNLENTYFRFGMVDGKAVLDTSIFADKIKNPEEKQRYLSPESELYKQIQKLLDEYISLNY